MNLMTSKIWQLAAPLRTYLSGLRSTLPKRHLAAVAVVVDKASNKGVDDLADPAFIDLRRAQRLQICSAASYSCSTG